MQHLVTYAVAIVLSTSASLAGDAITIDGLFDDWILVEVTQFDVSGDGTAEDFAELKITNDNDFLFIKFSLRNGERLLQDSNSIRLYLDTDNRADTGRLFHGIGAEIEWCFGCRQGIFYSASGARTIQQAELVLRSAPTVSSKDFELAFSLKSEPMTGGTTQVPASLAVVLAASDEVDLVPDQPGGVVYTIDKSSVEPPSPMPLTREHESDLRVMTYNTLGGGLLNPLRQEAFRRLIQAVHPDIMAFQEQGGAEQVRMLLESWLQESDLNSVMLGNNNLVVSKYPILDQALLTSSGRTMAVLLQTEPTLGSNLLILNSHLACCTQDALRQRDADELTMILRNWRTGAGPFFLPDRTPIIHLGDFNLVGASHQLRTLVEGDIVDEAQFGDDFSPDWDGSALTDLFSRHTSIGMGYTWRNDNSSFSPGKLDYILYSDSVIELGRHFVLNTLAMSPDDLVLYGLAADDTRVASDHLPRIMDVASENPVSVQDRTADIPQDFQLFPAFPNPFNPMTRIAYSLKVATQVSLTVYDLLGREVEVLVDGFQAAGRHEILFDASGLASGIYAYKLRALGVSQTKKLMLAK